MGSTPIREFSRNHGESITALEVGSVVGQSNRDVVLTTFSGKVLSYTQEKPKTSYGAAFLVEDSEKAMKALKKKGKETEEVKVDPVDELNREIASLRSNLKTIKDKYSEVSQQNVALTTQFSMKHDIRLVPEEACYHVRIEIDGPIDVVAIQTNVPVMILDVKSSKAIFSRSPVCPGDGNELLATYRFQEDSNSFEMKVRLGCLYLFAFIYCLVLIYRPECAVCVFRPRLEHMNTMTLIFIVAPLFVFVFCVSASLTMTDQKLPHNSPVPNRRRSTRYNSRIRHPEDYS